jgi:hypothetical protein
MNPKWCHLPTSIYYLVIVKRLNAQRRRTAATQVVVALQAFTERYPTGGLREFRVDEKL